MPPRCQACAHPKVWELNRDILEGMAHSTIARKYGLDRNAIIRHAKAHIPDAMHDAAAHTEGPVRMAALEGEVLLGQAATVYERALKTLDDMEQPGMDQRARVSALREVRACLEALAKLSFQIEDRGRGKINQTGAPEIDAAIVRALEARGVGVEPSAAQSDVVWDVPALEVGTSPADEVA